MNATQLSQFDSKTTNSIMWTYDMLSSVSQQNIRPIPKQMLYVA